MSEKIGERHAGHSCAGDFNWHFLFHRQESRVVEGRGWISAERSFSTLAVKFLCEGFMERDHSCPGIIYIVGERAARVPRWFKSLHSTVAPYFICIQNALRDVHPLSLSSTPLCTNANCTRLYPCRYSGAYYYRGEKKIFNVWQKLDDQRVCLICYQRRPSPLGLETFSALSRLLATRLFFC